MKHATKIVQSIHLRLESTFEHDVLLKWFTKPFVAVLRGAFL
jgi:hypothetical protein